MKIQEAALFCLQFGFPSSILDPYGIFLKYLCSGSSNGFLYMALHNLGAISSLCSSPALLHRSFISVDLLVFKCIPTSVPLCLFSLPGNLFPHMTTDFASSSLSGFEQLSS